MKKILFLVSLILLPIQGKANEITKELQENTTGRKGLIAYYYQDSKHENIQAIKESSDESLFNYEELIEMNNVGSARFIGYVNLLEGEVKLKTSNDQNSIIWVDNHIVSNKGDSKKIVTSSTKSQLHKIEVQVSNLDEALSIFMVNQNTKKTIELKKSDFLQPKLSSPFRKTTSNNNELSKDSDGDLIPDDFELNGYTYRKRSIVPWDESYLTEGYTKYLSNPFNRRTVGDPYTDYEKASQNIPLGNSDVTYNPVVAALPAINVSTKKIMLTEQGVASNTVSSVEEHSRSTTNSVGVSLNAGIEGKIPIFGGTLSFENSSTNGSLWGSSKSAENIVEKGKAASLNANVFYNNSGTGAIFNAQPSMNFEFDGGTIATVQANQNTEALYISSNESYPRNLENPGLSIQTIDPNGFNNIYLDRDQLKKFTQEAVPIIIHTNQTVGNYGILENGLVEIGGEWAPIESEVRRRTATIIINSNDGFVKEINVVGSNPKNPEDSSPKLTIREALLISFPEISNDGNELKINYTTLEGRDVEKKINYNSVISIFDLETQKQIEAQLNNKKNSVKTFLDCILTPDMNIELLLSNIYEDSLKADESKDLNIVDAIKKKDGENTYAYFSDYESNENEVYNGTVQIYLDGPEVVEPLKLGKRYNISFDVATVKEFETARLVIHKLYNVREQLVDIDNKYKRVNFDIVLRSNIDYDFLTVIGAFNPADSAEVDFKFKELSVIAH